MKASEKKAAREMIRDHEADIIIGTHALIQEDVEYAALSLVVSDEQHRFGVSQRGALAEKGDHPHRLVMSATPIPRTLAVILYGDLDISTIETKPAGRLPVKNAVIRKQDTASPGQVVAALCGDEATLKRYCPEKDRIVLKPENPAYPDIVIPAEEAERFRIQGVAVKIIKGVR